FAIPVRGVKADVALEEQITELKKKLDGPMVEAWNWVESQFDSETTDPVLLERQKHIYAYIQIARREKTSRSKKIIKNRAIRDQVKKDESDGVFSQDSPGRLIDSMDNIDWREKIAAL